MRKALHCSLNSKQRWNTFKHRMHFIGINKKNHNTEREIPFELISFEASRGFHVLDRFLSMYTDNDKNERKRQIMWESEKERTKYSDVRDKSSK